MMGDPEELDTALQLCVTSSQGMLGIETLTWGYYSNSTELEQQNGM